MQVENRGKCEVWYEDFTYAVKEMILEHYSNSDLQIFINPNPHWFGWNVPREIRSHSVYYQLEHIVKSALWEDVFSGFMNYFDEIWEFDINNIKMYPDNLKSKVKFMPLRYTSFFEPYFHITQSDDYDLGFIGTIDGSRSFKMALLTNNRRIKLLQSHNYSSIINNLLIRDRCSFVLNLHLLDSLESVQEQVRIFELISLGKSVVSEPSRINYFDGLIYEYTINQLMDLIERKKLVRFDETYVRDEYKRRTYTDEAFELYRSYFIDNYL